MTDISHSIGSGGGTRLLIARVRSADRVNVVLGAIFLLSAGFYLWTTGTTVPLSLHDGLGDRYNLLASAFLHLRLSVGPAPAALVHLANPYDPQLVANLPNGALPGGIHDANKFNDDSMYNGQFYFIWGPAPALVLLVPLHVLGFEPSTSFTVAFYAIVGLGFALATLRLLIRQIGHDVAIWMCVLAGLALALSSVVPYLLREPTITTDTLAGGYGFAMAGIWLAASAMVKRRASKTRLVLMSLCFGLAANSRPTLALTALVLIPVYMSLRSSRSRSKLLMCLALPVGICFALFLAYNQARFHNPFEVGSHYQITGYESRHAPLGRLSYVLPGVGFYALTLPQPQILFPFIHIVAPNSPGAPGVAPPEPTGGLLPLTPIVIFIAALPWIWRRRRARLGTLGPLVVTIAGVGLVLPIVPAYEFLASTERYEADFATLLVLAGLAAWLSLSAGTGHRRRLVRVGGGVLVAWGCATGFAVSFYGAVNELAVTHPATWRTLEDIGSPLSTVIAAAVGHPVVAAISAAHEAAVVGGLTNVGTNVTEFTLSPSERAGIIVVSPKAGRARLVAQVGLAANAKYEVRVYGPGHASSGARPIEGSETVSIPVSLNRGVNRFTLGPVATSVREHATTKQVMLVSGLSVTLGR